MSKHLSYEHCSYESTTTKQSSFHSTQWQEPHLVMQSNFLIQGLCLHHPLDDYRLSILNSCSSTDFLIGQCELSTHPSRLFLDSHVIKERHQLENQVGLNRSAPYTDPSKLLRAEALCR